MNEKLFEQIKALIAVKLDVDASKIEFSSSFRQDLGADSLDTYELVYQIEEDFDIKIPDEKAQEFETVGDAYEFISACLEAKESGSSSSRN
jgi:acyl carrier protein